MIKILSSKQVSKADKATIENEGITSGELMERAGNACAEWIKERFDNTKPVIVIAGIGNNGGDALVVSRLLLASGYSVETYVARYSEKFSEDFQLNLDRLVKSGHEIQYVLEEAQFPGISSEALIVEGMFGSGLNRKVEGFSAHWIEQINSSLAEVVSIDVPSGMYADRMTPEDHPVIEATYTLTFQVPKLAFLLPQSIDQIGDWHVLPIDLDPAYIATAESSYYFLDSISEYASAFQREKFSHKGSFGHSLIMAGSYGSMGAAVMATQSAVRSGSGLVSAFCPKCGYEIMQSTVPEAMCMVDDYYEYLSDFPELTPYSAIGIGPGIGTEKKTRRMLKGMLTAYKKPVVLDADAINLLSQSGKSEDWLPKNSILTPHPGEFRRLFGETTDYYKRLELLRNRAKEWNVFILLKGAHSALATPQGEVYFNSTGNPGMATGGSGDVLTGLITGFLAQTQDPFVSALCGMYIHGLAGDIAAEFYGQQAMKATDIIESIGEAIVQAFNSDT